MARVGYRLCSASLWPLYHRGFADNGWFDLNIYTNNPNPNSYFVYESLNLSTSVLADGNKCWPLRRGSSPSSSPLPFIYYLWQKRCSFRIPFTDKWYPFHIPKFFFFTSFNCYKCAVFKMWINHKTKKCSRLFYSHKIQLLILLSIFTDRFDRFPFPFIYSRTSEIPHPLIPEAWKRYWVLLR